MLAGGLDGVNWRFRDSLTTPNVCDCYIKRNPPRYDDRKISTESGRSYQSDTAQVVRGREPLICLLGAGEVGRSEENPNDWLYTSLSWAADSVTCMRCPKLLIIDY